MEFVADYAFVQRDIEGNCPERTTHDPSQFFSEKNPNVGATTQINPVSPDSSSRDRSDQGESTIADSHSDLEKIQARGRGEVPMRHEPGLVRTESARGREIRGEEFRRMEGVGRGQGGVSDLDHAV